MSTYSSSDVALDDLHDNWIDVKSREIWTHGIDAEYTEGIEPGVD